MIQIPQLDALESPARENLQAAVDAYAQSLIHIHEESVEQAQQALAEDPEIFGESMTLTRTFSAKPMWWRKPTTCSAWI